MTRGPAKQFDRDQVLDRAMHLFWTQGYEATGMTELLDHMGIGRQSLYNTFGDKKSLFLESLKRYFDQRNAIAREVLLAEGSPRANLRRFFQTMLEMARETDFCGCFMGNSAAEFGHREPEVQELVGRFMDRLAGLFTEVLARARDAGELPPDAPIEDMAQMLLVTSQGMALFSQIRPDAEASARMLDGSLAMMFGEAAAAPSQDRPEA